ncbi:MAG TPA: EAL domain-containing protein [Acidimicrobiia bacterium]|nr:EAL domain-containing protein [Acidimicrobiia bacterium]
MAPLRRFRNRHHLSLVVRFAILSLVLMTSLGVVLAWRLHSMIEHRNVASAGTNITLAVDFVANQQVQAGASAPSIATPQQLVQLRASMHALTKTGHIAGIAAVLGNAIVTFSDDESLVGRKIDMSPALRDAFRGQIRSAVLHGGSHASPHERALMKRYGKLVVVYAPVRLAGRPQPVAAIQAYIPYGPIGRAIASDTQTTLVILAFGFAILYLAVFRLVAGASRNLRRQAELNRELATHDALTGLPNRTLLRDRVEQAVRATHRTGRHVALMLLDLDRFKEVNDTLGHHHGDLLLQQVGPRLSAALRDSDTVARLGGDEFVVLVPDVASPTDATAIAEKIASTFDAPFTLDGVALDVDTSIGIAITPDDGDGFDQLLQRADVAMYVAKESHVGVNRYNPEHDAHSPTRLALLGELRRAIEDPDQLILHYQPKADVTTRRIVGVEALARWQHPTRGLVAPNDFIPAAERTGLIKPLTHRVLTIALAQARRWADAGVELRVAVNVSARCLLDLDFPTQVRALLDEHGVDATMLELELTESTIMSDPGRALEVLTSLHDMGVLLSIDDFGTGYSSMAYLKELPVDELKIDRAFVTGIADGGSDAAIVRSTVELARNLDLCVVAEGVETERVWNQLVQLGCDVAQGYYLSRPLPAEDLLAWLSTDPAARVASEA